MFSIFLFVSCTNVEKILLSGLFCIVPSPPSLFFSVALTLFTWLPILIIFGGRIGPLFNRRKNSSKIFIKFVLIFCMALCGSPKYPIIRFFNRIQILLWSSKKNFFFNFQFKKIINDVKLASIREKKLFFHVAH